MEVPRSVHVRNISLLVISMALWGLSFPAVKISLQEVEPLMLALLRVLLGAAPISAFVFWKRGFGNTMDILKKNPLPFLGISLTAFYLPMAAQNIGMGMMAPETAASLSSILQATSPLFGIFLAAMFLGEHIGVKKALGLALALSGSVLLVTRGGGVLGGSDLIGNMLLLGSAVSYAVSGVWIKKALYRYEPIMILTIPLIISTFLFIPTVFLLEPVAPIHNISGSTWLLILFLGLVCNGIALLLWYMVLVSSQLSKQVLYTYLIPVFGTVFSHIFLGEMIGYLTVIFGTLIVVGITIAQYDR